MTALLDAPAGDTALSRRDRAILELFYASGLRLSELTGLDVDDVNLSARMVRVLGKGRKERIVPFNGTTAAAVRAYLKDREQLIAARQIDAVGAGVSEPQRPGRAPWPPAGAAVRQLPRRAADGAQRRSRWCGGTRRQARLEPASARTPCAIRSPRTCCSAAPTCARFRSFSGTRASAPRSATPTSTRRSCSRSIASPTRARSSHD